MPDRVKKKVVELLREVQYLGGLEEKIADHLIAHGVTVQEDCKACAEATQRSGHVTHWMPLPQPPKGE